MTEQERWDLLTKLDEDLLTGGVILSEWCSFLTREADMAFAREAYLASILTAMSAIETHLRAESMDSGKAPLIELIQTSGLETQLKDELHRLRKYRNKWVHVDDPWGDQELIDHPDRYERQFEQMSFVAVKALRRVIYSNQWT